jgi:competence protein ComEA
MADYMSNTNRNMEGGKIDLNTASEQDLERISDIGADYARKIVDERNRRGGFDNIDELDSVPGIGPETIKQLKASATVRSKQSSNA